MKSCVFESRLFAQTQMVLIFYSTYVRVPIWMYAHMSPTLGAHTHAHGIWVGMGCDIIGNVTVFEYMGAI